MVKYNPDAPWCWNISLHVGHFWAIFGENVGKYSSTMEHLGNLLYINVVINVAFNGKIRDQCSYNGKSI
jgi:hypothetical protein